LNAAAQSNLPNTNWFDEIDSALQLQLLSEIAANSGIVALADEPRDVWRNLLFSFADAEHRGATGAREVALAWCKTSARFQSEVDFNRDWNSFNTRPGGITVATLLDAAAKVGYDLEPWRQVADGASIAASAITVEASPSAPASGPAAAQSLAISALPTVMAPDHALDLLNQMFFFAHDWGGEPLVGHVRSDGV
jgi:Primase C terminal 2 (PriCT-2)